MSAPADEVSLTRLERTICFGPRPVYEVELKSDGSATYYGEYFVDKMGLHLGRVAAEAFEQLARQVEGPGFF